jgi:hypothetical protein
MVMDMQSKFIILMIIVFIIIFSSIFIFYKTYNWNSDLSNLSEQSLIFNSTENKKNSLRVFDSPQIKVDILVPSTSNDGTVIENLEFEKIRTELATRFGGG